MYTLSEMNLRFAHLKSISPLGGQQLIEELRAAVIAYLTRDSEFELQVNKTLDKVIADVFFHGLEYENIELIQRWIDYPSGKEPAGYYNVEELFKGAEVFEEIMSVQDRDFRMAFYTETKDTADGYATTEYHNRYIENWIMRLNIAVSSELASLKAIMQYCANRSYNVEWAILFEELGRNINRHPVRYYAKEIFINRGYGWLIETFNLNIYRPSYMDELPNWTEEGN